MSRTHSGQFFSNGEILAKINKLSTLIPEVLTVKTLKIKGRDTKVIKWLGDSRMAGW